jgi:hypothetical protein
MNVKRINALDIKVFNLARRCKLTIDDASYAFSVIQLLRQSTHLIVTTTDVEDTTRDNTTAIPNQHETDPSPMMEREAH